MLAEAEKYKLYEDGQLFELEYPSSEDLQFWIDEAAAAPGNEILELACGTGRLLDAMANAGYDCTGLDLSTVMLSEAVKKNAEVQWLEADIRSFDLKERFALVILTGNSICHLLDAESVESCFGCVLRHLKQSGRFIVNVFVPAAELLLPQSEMEEEFATYKDPATGVEVKITHTYRYDADTQVKHVTLHHYLSNGSVEHSALEMRMFFPEELDDLLRNGGFRILEKWDDYQRNPFGPGSTQQIVVCEAT